MHNRIDNFIIREADGTSRFANTLVLGRGAAVATTPGGLPELVGARAGETQLLPSGGDDTQRLANALAVGNDVRLGPGVFRLSATVVVGTPLADGPAPRLVGSGITRTRLRMSGTGPAVVLRGDHTAIEALTVEGPGTADVGSTGIHVGEPPAPPPPEGVYFDLIPNVPRTVTGASIRDVRVEKAGFGIRLVNAASCSLRGVSVAQVAETGIVAEGMVEGILPAPDLPGPLVLDGVQVDGATSGIALSGVRAVAANAVTVRGCSAAGVSLEGGAAHRLGSVRVAQCQAGLVLHGVRAAAVQGAEISECASGIQLFNSRDVQLAACSVAGANGSLLVQGSEDVVVGTFRSDMSTTGAAAPGPHLRVQSSAGVFVTSLRVVNSSTIPVYEVDVAQAGGRVLFGPHNVAPARISSGGNFAQL